VHTPLRQPTAQEKAGCHLPSKQFCAVVGPEQVVVPSMHAGGAVPPAPPCPVVATGLHASFRHEPGQVKGGPNRPGAVQTTSSVSEMHDVVPGLHSTQKPLLHATGQKKEGCHAPPMQICAALDPVHDRAPSRQTAGIAPPAPPKPVGAPAWPATPATPPDPPRPAIPAPTPPALPGAPPLAWAGAKSSSSPVRPHAVGPIPRTSATVSTFDRRDRLRTTRAL
jgi:hypothetical protein